MANDKEKLASIIAQEWSEGGVVRRANQMNPPVYNHQKLHYRNGLPTLDTLRANGKINLIDYPDPNSMVTEKPRKHLHSYLIFVKATRNDLKINNPNLTFKELSQLMADRWKSLPEHERAEYELLSAEDKRIREI